MADLARKVAQRVIQLTVWNDDQPSQHSVVSKVADRHIEAKMGWDGKFVGKDARLQWSRASWNLEELPQKGKKKLRTATLQNPSSHGYLDWYIPGNILQIAKLSSSDDYDKIKSKIEDAYKEAGDKSAESKHDRERDTWEKSKEWVTKLKWYENQVFYLEVTPEGVEDFTAEAKDFTVKVEWGNFSAYAPYSDLTLHDPHYTQYEAKSPGAGRKFYKLLKADPNALKSVAWNTFSDWLRKNGVGYDMHFSQWT
jgi:hypothetical protein